jgi:hypothetical protein
MSKTSETATPKPSTSAADAWPFASAAAWQDLAREQVARAQAFGESIARSQGELQTRLQTTTDDALKLVNDSLAHLVALSAEWNRVVLEATRRATTARD